jgi:hypothetical protein
MWEANTARLRSQLIECRASRDEIEEKCRRALEDQRNLEVEALRLERLARQMQSASAETSALNCQLQTMHSLNAHNKVTARKDADEIAALKAELEQTKAEAYAQHQELVELRELRDRFGWSVPAGSPPASPGTVTVAPRPLA